MLDRIEWLGHASFRIHGDPTIVIDPWRVTRDEITPDVILVSHEHYDHCSPADIAKLMGSHTRVIASQGASSYLQDIPHTVLRPWQTINLGRSSVRGVPAYTFKGDHPAHREDLGFIISTNYTDIYYAGDTDFVPELRRLCCDIAILPICGRNGIMNAEAAATFVDEIRPRYVLPSHVGARNEGGGQLELNAFQRAMQGRTEFIPPSMPQMLAYR